MVRSTNDFWSHHFQWKKVYKYGETCEELGYDLIPFAIETYGKFGKAALKHLKILQTMALEEGVR